jgi:WD40 repeat protein
VARLKRLVLLQGIKALTSHTDWVLGLAWHPSSSHHLVTASKDTSLKLWDLRTPIPLHTVTGHTEQVHNKAAESLLNVLLAFTNNAAPPWFKSGAPVQFGDCVESPEGPLGSRPQSSAICVGCKCDKLLSMCRFSVSHGWGHNALQAAAPTRRYRFTTLHFDAASWPGTSCDVSATSCSIASYRWCSTRTGFHEFKALRGAG